MSKVEINLPKEEIYKFEATLRRSCKHFRKNSLSYIDAANRIDGDFSRLISHASTPELKALYTETQKHIDTLVQAKSLTDARSAYGSLINAMPGLHNDALNIAPPEAVGSSVTRVGELEKGFARAARIAGVQFQFSHS